jgi:acyl-CoA oxidase
VIDYQTQQYKLFPLLATSYAMYFAGRFMYEFYLKATAEIEAGNLESMPQVMSHPHPNLRVSELRKK